MKIEFRCITRHGKNWVMKLRKIIIKQMPNLWACSNKSDILKGCFSPFFKLESLSSPALWFNLNKVSYLAEHFSLSVNKFSDFPYSASFYLSSKLNWLQARDFIVQKNLVFFNETLLSKYKVHSYFYLSFELDAASLNFFWDQTYLWLKSRR